MEYNFLKYDLNKIDHLGAEYDTCSVMHYGSYAFSKVREEIDLYFYYVEDAVNPRCIIQIMYWSREPSTYIMYREVNKLVLDLVGGRENKLSVRCR